MILTVGTSGGRRFHLLEVLGRGAFGEVFLAEQDSGTGFRRRVAIKVLVPGPHPRDVGRRMRDEARVLGRLDHRHVVTALDLVELDGRHAIVMEYVPGADLEHVVDALVRTGERFPLPAALETGAAILDALDAAYTADDGHGVPLGVIHRDIKPSNVRLTPDGDVKVLDFGVARFSHAMRETRTRASGWIGTELYMAPERILCEGDTAAGDVYAATATWLELLLGRPVGRTPVVPSRHAAFVHAVVGAVRPRLDGDPADREAVVAAIRGGLALEPEARPTARALSDELDRLARSLPGESLRTFARRFVPRVQDVLGRAPMPATGVLGERSGGVRTTLTAQDVPVSVLPIATDAVRRHTLPLLVSAPRVAALGSTLVVVALAATPASVEPGPELPELVALTEAPAETSPPSRPRRVEEPVVTPPRSARRPRQRTVEPEPTASLTLSRAHVSMKGASGLVVMCGPVIATGTASVRITDFPADVCHVEATVLDTTYTTEVLIDEIRRYQCRIHEGELHCS